MRLRYASFLPCLLALTGIACGGDGSSGPGSGGPLPGDITTPEIPNNPQKWALLPGNLLTNEGHPGKTVRVGSQYRTYFVRRVDSTLVFATSMDVISSGPITVTNLQLVNVKGDLRAKLDHPTVIRRADGKYLLVYDYWPDPFLTTCCAKQLIARISDDGITWGAAIPMPASDQDNSPGTKKPFMGVTGMVQLPDGSIRAYYTTTGGYIGSSRSGDGGATWTEDAGYRIQGPRDTGFVEPSVMLDTDGSVLLYVGYRAFTCPQFGASTNCWMIRMARSTDGLNFKVYQGSILSNTTALFDGDVFIGPDGKWRMVIAEDIQGALPLLRVAERQ